MLAVNVFIDGVSHVGCESPRRDFLGAACAVRWEFHVGGDGPVGTHAVGEPCDKEVDCLMCLESLVPAYLVGRSHEVPDAYHFRLSRPLWDFDNVLVSVAADASFVCVYPATSDGLMDPMWRHHTMDGSYDGGRCHARALAYMGYRIVLP